MLTDEIARAVQSAPRSRLAELAATIWRAFGAGAIGETDAQALAEAVEARKRIPAVPTQPRRIGSRPRAPESLERRRRWVASGWVPPQIACRFTAGELSALSVVAAQVAKHGRWRSRPRSHRSPSRCRPHDCPQRPRRGPQARVPHGRGATAPGLPQRHQCGPHRGVGLAVVGLNAPINAGAGGGRKTLRCTRYLYFLQGKKGQGSSRQTRRQRTRHRLKN